MPDGNLTHLSPVLSIVVPTFKEALNVKLHYASLSKALAGVDWEVVYVDDDSPDGTSDVLRDMSQQHPNLRLIHRIGRKGLASAVIEGILSTAAPYVAVMDCDLQHDEKLLPLMLKELQSKQYDVVVGSRFVDGGSTGDWDEKRLRMSKLATRLSRMVVTAELSDPMSGYFMLTRAAFAGAVKHLSGQGFKILLDIFASSPKPLRFKELPFTFGLRQHGESKVDTTVLIEYAYMLIDKYFHGWLPPRLVLFSLVGAFGAVVHFAVLSVLYLLVGSGFSLSQSIATAVAMTSNYAYNNEFTFRDRRLTGWRWLAGLLSFYAISAVGVFGNVGVANYLFGHSNAWWLSALAGIAIGTIWNFSLSSAITWRKR